MTRSLKCSVIASAVTMVALGALAAPALAAITTTRDAPTIASAIVADTSTITSSSFQEIAPTGSSSEEPNAVSTTALGGFATNGSSYGILTTGDATLADQANSSGSDGVGLGGDNGTTVRGDNDFDVTVLKVDLNVPASVNCMTVDFRFLSEEYPEFVGSSVNDAFVAELDTSDWATDLNTAEVTAPHNFAFDPNGNPITINAAGAASMSAAEATGTTYDGATPLLAASTPITPGAHSVYLSIFDQGDDIYDSAVFLDNVRFSNRPTGTCVAGATSGEILAVAKNGSGTVTSSPAGIDCGATCTKSFTKNTVVTLTPTASAGWTFTGWSGDCSGTGACTVTMDQARSVTATFTLQPPPPTYTLTVGKNGTGSGTVTSSPAGISCGATCSQAYTQGTGVTLTPTAATGSTFAGWSGDCSGTGACTVTMSQARSVTATFNLNLPPVVGVPPSVPASGLFCGVQHRGKCNGIKVKTAFTGPGNAVWQFGVYNPNPGHSSARAAAVKLLALGQVKRRITKAGTVTVVFKLKAGARTRKLYRQAVKRKLTRLRVKVIYTTPSGQRLVKTKNIKLKLNR
jgi:uncharacterized repeat protein (TIGR02543 family)